MKKSFFQSQGNAGKKKRKLAPLRNHNRREIACDDEKKPEIEAATSALPNSVVDTTFKTALHQHETESRIEDHNYDDEDEDNGNGNDDDNGDDNDNDNEDEEDEDAEDQVGGDRDKAARFDQFRRTVAVATAFEDHMKSREGGEKSSENAKLAVKRVWGMLEGTYLKKQSQLLEPTEVAVHAWILSLIETEFAQISRYLDDLAHKRGLQSNTVKAYITSSYLPFFIWYRLFSMVVPQPSPDGYARLHVVLKSLIANYRKLAKVTKRLETKTVEELIATKQWPPGGIAELQAAYLANLPHILCAFDPGVERYTHNDEFFRAFMELMMFGKLDLTLPIVAYLILIESNT